MNELINLALKYKGYYKEQTNLQFEMVNIKLTQWNEIKVELKCEL